MKKAIKIFITSIIAVISLITFPGGYGKINESVKTILMDPISATILVGFIVFIVIIVIAIKRTPKQTQNQSNRTTEYDHRRYEVKNLLTATEEKYFAILKHVTPSSFTVYPQINLASIINRVDRHRYQSELFRNIDFAIFDSSNRPVLLIEINDNSHKKQERIERDRKVKEICDRANIPLITFWTEDGASIDKIRRQVLPYCN